MKRVSLSISYGVTVCNKMITDLIPKIKVGIGNGNSRERKFSPKFIWPKFFGNPLVRDGPTTTTTIFEFISRGPIFHFWGTLGWRTKCPSRSGTQRNHKEFSSDVPSNAVLVRHQMQNLFGRLWLWLCLGRPWLRVVDVCAFRSWMSEANCLFSQGFEGPDRSFGAGYPREWPPDVRGISGPKTSSLAWAALKFSPSFILEELKPATVILQLIVRKDSGITKSISVIRK